MVVAHLYGEITEPSFRSLMISRFAEGDVLDLVLEFMRKADGSLDHLAALRS